MSENHINVAVVGAGMISMIYLANLTGFKAIKVRAIADIIPEKAQKMARDFNIEKACSVGEVLEESFDRIIVNLTVPKAHAEVTVKGIAAGKHVYGEKPLATNREDGKKILEAARSKAVRVGIRPGYIPRRRLSNGKKDFGRWLDRKASCCRCI